VPNLIKALKNDSPDVRAQAAGFLGEFGSDAKEAIPALLEACDDEDEAVRTNARRALKKIDPEEAKRSKRT
jgi:HEAT repeat protein